MVRYCRLVNLSETEMVKLWPEMENPGVIAQANLEALVIKRLSWPQPDQPLGLGIRVPPRHGHLKLMIDAIGHFKFIYYEKATKFCEIFTLLLTTIHTVKSKVKILQNFVAFSEYTKLNWSTTIISK